MKLPSTDQSGMNEAFEEVQRTLGLKRDIDPFDVFRDVGANATPIEDDGETIDEEMDA